MRLQETEFKHQLNELEELLEPGMVGDPAAGTKFSPMENEHHSSEGVVPLSLTCNDEFVSCTVIYMSQRRCHELRRCA